MRQNLFGSRIVNGVGLRRRRGDPFASDPVLQQVCHECVLLSVVVRLMVVRFDDGNET
jgi:hypothetical protein